ncbi:MAG TPA: hypothetical protein VN256_00665 [Pyrinomonadaceae bacterium]|nr:hypothetical protein [Pyrinomonadaceae bacterium]
MFTEIDEPGVWQRLLDRFFPVEIESKPDVLVIEDRRPGDGFVVSVTIAALSLVIPAILFKPLVSSGIYWPLALLLAPAPIFIVNSLLASLREKYVFDKGRDAYTLTRRSVVKSKTQEGMLSEIRAVQVERTVVSSTEPEHQSREIFRVALLLGQGMRLGSSDIVHLREGTPVGSNYSNEAQMASAIAGFLKLPPPETVKL